MERVPPHSVEAEQCVLGCMMLDAEALSKAVRLLNADDFYLEKHRMIFNAITSVKHCDITTVSDALEKMDMLQKVGDIEYLANLAGNIQTTQMVTAHVGIVLEKSQYRKFISASEQITSLAMAQSKSVLELKGIAFEMMDVKVASQSEGTGMPDATTKFVKLLEDRKTKKGADIKTGLPWLDRKTNGLFPGNSVILAARPSVGKTTLAVQIAKFNAYRGKHILIFSLEMTDMQITEKMIANDAYVNTNQLKMPQELTPQEQRDVNDAIAEIATLPITIYDNIFNIEDIISISKQRKAEHGIGLVVIDYLQMVQTTRKFQNNNDRVGFLSSSIKQLAKSLNCPIITLSQLRRPQEGANHEPTLVDLRDSGNIEQDADVVILLHDPNATVVDSKSTELMCKIGKQREGERDVGHMFHYQKPQQRITEEER
jgi:replicative DNA helicase